MRIRLLPVSLLAVLLAASSCTSKPAASPPPLDGLPQPSQSATMTGEGPADQPSQWPDSKVTARLVKVEKLPTPPDVGAAVAKSESVVRLTLTVANDRDQPLGLTSDFLVLWYGPNRTPAKGTLGIDDEQELNPEPPTRVAAHGQATLVQSFLAPTAELGVLAVNMGILDEPPMVWTFTDAQKLLR